MRQAQSLPPGNLSLSRGVRQKQITPVQRGTHSMLCLVQEGGVWERKTSWRKWLLSRFMKEEEAWQRRGFEMLFLKPKMPRTKTRGESMNVCGGNGGPGGPERVMDFRRSMKWLVRQGEQAKGPEQIINMAPEEDKPGHTPTMEGKSQNHAGDKRGDKRKCGGHGRATAGKRGGRSTQRRTWPRESMASKHQE